MGLPLGPLRPGPPTSEVISPALAIWPISPTGDLLADIGGLLVDTRVHLANTGEPQSDTGDHLADEGDYMVKTGSLLANTDAPPADTGGSLFD